MDIRILAALDAGAPGFRRRRRGCSCRELVALGAKLERPVLQRRWGCMANPADPFGHGIDLLQFQGRGYDEMLEGG